MSTDNLHALYAPSDIIPAISINAECGDHNNNYVIIPLPKEILSNAQSQAKEAVYPLDSRFINLYNNKTGKYSLPYLNNVQEYRKLYVYYLKNITISKFALEDTIDTWEIDRSIDISKLFIQIVD